MNSFDISQLFFKYRYKILAVFVGIIFVFGGVIVYKNSQDLSSAKVEVLSESDKNSTKEITAEISGEVIKPGVYKVNEDSRIDDLLLLAGGFSANADRVWTDKYLNRAAKITDGQKIFIPKASNQTNSESANKNGLYQSGTSQITSDSTGLININSASLSQLDSLPGIGQVYGQNIIEHRPYSSTSELLSKGVLKKNVYEKIKDLVSTY